MGTLSKLGPLSGVSDLTSLLDLLSDPKKYKAALAALTAQIDELNVRIEAVGKVKEIARLRGEAEQMNREASATLKAVTDRIANDQAHSQKSIQEASAKSAAKIGEEREKLEAAQALVSQREKAVGDREKAVEKVAAEAQTIHDAVSKEKVRVEALMSQYKNKVALIEETLGRVA